MLKNQQNNRRVSVFFTLTALVVVLLSICSSPLRAADITINWRQKLDSGRVSDLKFMPGQEQFIVGLGLSTEVRSCDNGEKINVYPFGSWQIEFSTDSNKIVTILPINGYKTLQLRSADNMELLKELILPPDEEGYGISFQEIKVDPLRPYIYALWEKTKVIHETYENYTKIQIYDINTLELVSEITDGGNDLGVMAISKDGKYLAAMSIGASYLIVWDLDTRIKVIDKQIGIWKGNDISEPADIKFSELNTDKIYFTGKFYQPGNAETLEGLCIFSISENRIIDSTFAIKPNNFGWNPEICLFENETKVIGTSGVTAKILDLIGKKIEFEMNILGNNLVAISNVNYHNKEKYFIGGGGNTIDRFKYNPNTSIATETSNKLIYPNPTTGNVSIPIDCQTASKYEIYNTRGKLIKSNKIAMDLNNFLIIDFAQYDKGLYFVNVYCGKDILKFQVVKGE